MRELAESLGLAGAHRSARLYRLDLEQGATCPDRQRAVAKLRALRDPAAIAALKKAEARKLKPVCAATPPTRSAISSRWGEPPAD